MKNCFLFILITLCLTACQEKKTTVETPWGTTISSEDGTETDTEEQVATDGHYSLSDILQGGEMIMLTLSGPDTYYDYHGRGMGVHYLLCEKLAEHLGVTLRVDVCKDTLDMLTRLRNCEGDIIAFPLSRKDQVGFIPVTNASGKTVKNSVGWVVGKQNKDLARAIISWYKPTFYADVKKQENYMLTTGSVTRHVYPMMLSASKGQISNYDNLFRKYASTANMDWIMMAAQCYQESCFDPKAHSWAGACGLMQIMPATADHLSLPREKIYEPEQNIAASARYMRELQGIFSDVGNPAERLKFALAAYNGGYYHIRDAMELTKKHGGIAQRWDDVKRYVLLLSNAQYYRDPVVKNGYMRGSETVNYVDMITQRHSQYRQALRTGGKVVSTVKSKDYNETKNISTSLSGSAAAHRASKKNKWR